jgi:hypothetical protein
MGAVSIIFQLVVEPACTSADRTSIEDTAQLTLGFPLELFSTVQ